MLLVDPPRRLRHVGVHLGLALERRAGRRKGRSSCSECSVGLLSPSWQPLSESLHLAPASGCTKACPPSATTLCSPALPAWCAAGQRGRMPPCPPRPPARRSQTTHCAATAGGPEGGCRGRRVSLGGALGGNSMPNACPHRSRAHSASPTCGCAAMPSCSASALHCCSATNWTAV